MVKNNSHFTFQGCEEFVVWLAACLAVTLAVVLAAVLAAVLAGRHAAMLCSRVKRKIPWHADMTPSKCVGSDILQRRAVACFHSHTVVVQLLFYALYMKAVSCNLVANALTV